jgi:stalled ribosome alternative rescue factor ArfA
MQHPKKCAGNAKICRIKCNCINANAAVVESTAFRAKTAKKKKTFT